MAYIGRQLARGENKLFDDISSSFNGSTTTFNLTVSSVATSTATALQLFVTLNGVLQKPNTDFTTAGNQITFATAPANGVSCFILMQGDAIDSATVSDGSITPLKLGGQDFAFTGDIRLKDADGSNYVGFKSPTTVTSNVVWTLPAADTSVSGYVLSSNGSGVLSWVEAGDSSSPSFTGDVTLSNDGSIVGFSSLHGTYTGSVKTYTVTVASKSAAHRYNGTGSGSGYKINGKEAPFLTLTPGRTYKFDQSDGSNSGHPFRFYLEAAKTTAYTTGVTTNGTAGSSGAYTQIVVSDTTPQVLHYQCSAHGYMGNAVQTNSNVAAAGSLNGATLASSVTGSSLTSVGTLGSLAVSGNATVGGNLTVSGTTTTVDSVTLSVKDKNIEMGVVSSPSDTTADGGGITLKGASDHTFNWINATDAWTSSEHIHLLDNKKLFVGGTSGTTDGLEILHDGSNSFIKDAGTGSLFIYADGTYLKNAAGNENLAAFVSNGAAELYHNNVKRIETTSSGAKFTGKLSALDGTGSAGSWIALGDSDDLRIYHSGSESFIADEGTGGLTISGGTLTFKNQARDETHATMTVNGGVELFYDNNSKFKTTSTGVEIDGRIDGKSGDHLDIRTLSSHSIQLRTNNTLRLELQSGGHLVPYLDSTYDLGTNSNRFRNVYADTLYGDGANLTNLPATGGSVDLTASGSITANKGVIVNASGQVTALVGAVASTGSRVEWESGIKYNNTCKLSDDKYVVCYHDTSNSSAGVCRVVTVSGTTPSFGSEAQFEHNTTNWIKICALDSSRFAIIFHTPSANEIEVQIGSVSGTNISYGTAVATGFTGNPADYGTAIGYQSDVNGLLLFGSTAANSDKPYYRTCRPSGTTVNMSNTWVLLENNTGAHDLNVVENTTDNELLLTWISSSQQNGGRSCTLKLSGSSGYHSVTVGQNELISNQNQYRSRVCYNSDDNVYGYIFRNQDKSNRIDQSCGTPSGSGTGRTISWTSYAQVYGSAASTNKPNIAYSSAASRYLLIYGASNNNGRWIVYKQSGASMVADGSEASYETSRSTIANPYMNVLDIGNGKFAVTYPGDTSKGYAIIRQLASTNLTAENFIGFASASYSNGQTATINVVGNTIGGQSSLTPGQRYFVAGDGTISLTAGEPEVIAGTAISSTTLLIKPQ